jgi:diguanylate cyclase (GGDEF)-like protein
MANLGFSTRPCGGLPAPLRNLRAVRVLLVDDSRVARELTASYLLEMGHPVAQAADGAAALELYRSQQVDLVLLDVEMPGMDGYQVARRMRDHDAADHWVPIIYLSGRVADDDVEHGIEAGGDDYISKPVSPTVLRAKLKAMHRLTDVQARLREVTTELQHVNRELVVQSALDALTGIPNRRSFDRALEREWQRGRRTGKPVSLIMGDVDFFKRYNDAYGHHRGDECLQAVASALARGVLRPGDLVARFGGEEFVALLPETGLPGGTQIAERLVGAVRALALPHEHSDTAPHVTMSFGVAACVPEASITADQLLETADAALYRAKGEGRDRVAWHPVPLVAAVDA